jgi:NAD(P)-dependent dehydrogenase (short-subunit alcohol dehydrogenase family)
VNISSIAGKRFPAGVAAYAASKAGVQALTGCLAREVASVGIRVNTICPAVVDTSRMDVMGRGESWEDFIRRYVDRLQRGPKGWRIVLRRLIVDWSGTFQRSGTIEEGWTAFGRREGKIRLSAPPACGRAGRSRPGLRITLTTHARRIAE